MTIGCNLIMATERPLWRDETRQSLQSTVKAASRGGRLDLSSPPGDDVQTSGFSA